VLGAGASLHGSGETFAVCFGNEAFDFDRYIAIGVARATHRAIGCGAMAMKAIKAVLVDPKQARVGPTI
jgi:hypothetical protein